MQDLYEALNAVYEDEQSENLSESNSGSALEQLKAEVTELAKETGLELYVSGAEEDGESADLFCTEMFDVAGTGQIMLLEYEGGEYDFDKDEIIAHLRTSGLIDDSFGDLEDEVKDYVEYNYIDEDSSIDSMIEEIAENCLYKDVEELTEEEREIIRKVLVDWFELDESCNLQEATQLDEAALRPTLDSIAIQIRSYLAKNKITTATHPVEVFPCYDLGLVKVVFKGTGVSYTVVPKKLDDKVTSVNRPVKVMTHYPTAIYNGAGSFVDPSTGSIIGDAYVAVARSGNKSDYSDDLSDLLIKSSDTMVDFSRFVKHIAKDSIKGNRIEK